MFVWRLTPHDSFPNYLAWVIVTVAAARNLFNFNPLLKLDGYYLLSDAMEIPNLRQRAWDRFMAAARWLLWGGARPGAEPHARFLTLFGLASWAFSLVFLCLMLVGYLKFLGNRWGPVGFAAVAVLAMALSPHMFVGLSSGEFGKMITTRRKRVALWVLGLAAVSAGAALLPVRGPRDRRVRGSLRATAPNSVRPRPGSSGRCSSNPGSRPRPRRRSRGWRCRTWRAARSRSGTRCARPRRGSRSPRPAR